MNLVLVLVLVLDFLRWFMGTGKGATFCQMLSCNCRLALLAIFCLLLAPIPVRAQHVHIYAGAVEQTPGAPLFFQNADVWDTNSYGGYTQSPACMYLERNIPNLYPGLYQTATTFVSLPATIFNGGPSVYAASFGTYIELKFVSLQGPAGGVLTIWSEVDDPQHPAVLFTIPTGTANGTNRYNLSESDPNDPSADPYGHIHGRRFTLNKPGLYILGLQLVDTSNNGPGGGPVQSPSEITYFYMQSGLFLSDLSRSNNVTTARFGLPGFTNFVFEASPTPGGSNWVTVANIVGSDHSELRWVTETNTASRRFYRMRRVTN
jgi:hypothetical protein